MASLLEKKGKQNEETLKNRIIQEYILQTTIKTYLKIVKPPRNGLNEIKTIPHRSRLFPPSDCLPHLLPQSLFLLEHPPLLCSDWGPQHPTWLGKWSVLRR